MTKRQRLHSLETRIGQLSVHINKNCPLPSLWDDEILAMSDKKLDKAIAARLAWLRANNEKERMGRRRY
jgi:hypothetical protein